MLAHNRMPAFMHPAGQVAPPAANLLAPVPPGTVAVDAAGNPVDAAGNPVTAPASTLASGLPSNAVGMNSQGQLVDASGNLLTDANGNILMGQAGVPYATTASPAAVPASTQTFGAMFISVLATIAIVGGAAYAGSYYGTRNSMRRASRAVRAAE